MSQTKAQLIDPVDGTIVNADINASAAIAGTKVSPDFGSQNITTTGNITSSAGEISTTNGSLVANKGTNNQVVLGHDGAVEISRNGGGAFIDFKNDPSEDHDARIQENNGGFDISGNVNIASGCDVTGAITGTGDLTIDTNTLHVDSSNNRVGIGTTSPNQLLEVANSSGGATISISTDEQAGSTASKKYNNLDFTGYNNTVMARIQSWDESSSTGHGYLTFFTNKTGVGFTEKLRIDPDGNVGIGTTSPAKLLDVKEESNGTVEQYLRNTVINLLSKINGTTSAQFGTETAHPLVFLASNNERMRIDSSGSVIIGDDASDKANAHFNDLIVGACDSSTETHGITIVTGSSATNGGIAFSDGSNGGVDAYRGMISYHHNDNHMQFRTNALERMRIDSSGRLLHGVTASVDVASTASAQTQIHSTNSTLQLAIAGYGNNSGGAIFALGHSRSVGVGDASGQLSNNDEIGTIRFAASDGTDMENTAASIIGIVDGNVSSNSTPGAIIFYTNNGSSHAEKLRIRAAGGITFNGDTAAANALNDYEEGTWTPAFKYYNGSAWVDVAFSNTPVTTNAAYYTKIGNMVHWSYYSENFLITTGAGSFAAIEGLPFTNNGGWGAFAMSHADCFADDTENGAHESGSTRLRFFIEDGITSSTWSSSLGHLMIAGSYRTNT